VAPLDLTVGLISCGEDNASKISLKKSLSHTLSALIQGLGLNVGIFLTFLTKTPLIHVKATR
jgi:hypothetical protein